MKLTAALARALALLVACTLQVRRWLRPCRPRPLRRAPRGRPAIVLAHGLFGYDVLERGGERVEYFRGVRDHLARRGWPVHVARVAPVASISTRAEALARFVNGLPHRRVHLVAHSMGGLDARYAIARLGLSARVASLTTIGTPHRGTPMANLGVALGRGLRMGHLLERLGVDREAFHDLTTARAAAFNEVVGDVPGVAYASVVGVVARVHHVHPLLLPTWALLRSAAGANDGMVPAASQRWGEVLAEVEADHFALVGNSRVFDAAALYDRLALALRERCG